MKKYKVGDTIYMKGTVVQIDENDYERPYCIKYVNGDYGAQEWPKRSAIIDELPTAEPVKPVLPKDVADEMLKAKEKNEFFDLYIERVIGTPHWYPHSSKYWHNHDGNNTETLLNAWDNGYTVEEKKYSVKVPHTKDVWYYKSWDSDLRTVQGKLATKFTEAEIEKYGLQDCEKVEVTDDEQ